MKDIPIIFSAPMVRALLEGRKTQTRRVLKPQPALESSGAVAYWTHPKFPGGYPAEVVAAKAARIGLLPCAPGDRLWVREALCFNHDAPVPFTYEADGARVAWGIREQVAWLNEYARDKSPGIHMPRWASRLTLLVTDVRVQRLQDISEADAVAEGVRPLRGSEGPNYFTVDAEGWGISAPTARDAFERLWCFIHGPDAWAENPWVAAISFNVVKANIDKVQP